MDFQAALELVNVVLASGITIFSFALVLYIAIYNLRNDVARSFAILLGCVVLTYFVDLALSGAENIGAAIPWLQLQWVGIAFTPAAYLHFSNALLCTTGARSRLRDLAVRLSYLLSAGLLVGVAFSDFVVQGGALTYGAAHLLPGPLFPLFVVYFFAAVVWGGTNVLWARRRCLTSTSRRRMAYLAATFAAPAAGVFPYLLLAGWPDGAPGVLLWALLLLGNVGIMLMLMLFAYSVTFFGALTPDRVVKRRLARFLLRGPFAAIVLVVVIVVALQTEGWSGLSGRRLVLFGVVGVVLLLQVGIEFTKPLLDRALYRQDYPEVEWLQELGNRLLTTTDLRQFLENVLTALCDLLRVDTAFVAVIDDGRPHLEVVCGSLALSAADELPPEAWQESPEAQAPRERRVEQQEGIFVWNGYWLVPLRDRDQSVVTGVVGIAARSPRPDLTAEEREGMETLLAQATAALEDRQLQQSLFRVLERIIPEIEDIQRRRGVVRYVGEQALSGFSLVENVEFRQWVRDALSHYWGGPKLITNPLLSLRVVERATQEQAGNAIKGLRTVLKQAIERLRPDGQRQMTAPEWILYNILELKFLQGRRVREVTLRLAMSESDLYRKQRVAIEAVAQVLAEMEREELSNQKANAEDA
jgi:GAF domain-containing protein